MNFTSKRKTNFKEERRRRERRRKREEKKEGKGRGGGKKAFNFWLSKQNKSNKVSFSQIDVSSICPCQTVRGGGGGLERWWGWVLRGGGELFSLE